MFVDIYYPPWGHSGINDHMKTRRHKSAGEASAVTSKVSN